MKRRSKMRWIFVWTLAATFLLPPVLSAAPPLKGHHDRVNVSAETRLDWMFALANQSREQPPDDWLPGYDSVKQQYELYVPTDYNPKKSYPVVLFINAGGTPAGWSQWQSVFQQQDVIFASPYNAGNDCAMPKRVRIVMDVLDDLRRNYRVDADRTYISGFSGGGRVACAIAFALPEYFGGVIPVCAGGDLRDESWLRQRVIDRLSVALVTGENDFNRGEVERFRGTMLPEMGVRTKVWIEPKMGHGIPGGERFAEVFRWLEDGAAARRDMAKKYPASRVNGDAAPNRQDWSQALLKEAQGRLKNKQAIYSGLMQLQGVSTRWADLPAGVAAKKLLVEYDAKTDRPWDEDDIADQRRFLIAQARSLDAYASGPLAQQYIKMRPDMARAAIGFWKQILEDGPQTKPGKEAAERIPELQKLVDGK
jgi:predicted esterase